MISKKRTQIIFAVILTLAFLLFSFANVSYNQSAAASATATPYPNKNILTAENSDQLTEIISVESNLYINTMEFSPDGSLLAIGGDDGTIELWETQTSKKVSVLQGHTDFINDLAFSSDGKFLASASRDKTVRIWDIDNGKELEVFQDHKSSIAHVKFSPDDKFLLSSAQNAAILWQLENNTKTILVETQQGEPDPAFFTAEFNSSGSRIAVSARNTDATIWSLPVLKLHGQVLCNNQQQSAEVYTPVMFSPDGSLLACGLTNGSIQVWDISSLKEEYAFQQTHDTVKSVLFSPNGKFLASTGNRTVQLWNIAAQDEISEPLLGCDGVTNAVFSPNSSLMVYGAYCAEKQTGVLALYNTNTGKQITVLDISKPMLTYITFNPKGNQIVSGDETGKIRFWMLK